MAHRPELHRGRLAKHPRVLSVRPLTRDDLLVLKEKRVGPPKIKQYRDTHHRVARLVAAGLRDIDVARMSGYSPTRIGGFKQDPAFQQLVAEYRGKVDEAYVESQDEFYNTSVSNMLRAERMLEEHLDRAEDDGDLIPLKSLLQVTADRADRFGYGKHATQTTEVRDFAKMMEQLAAKSGRSNVIDAGVSRPLVPVSEPGGESTPSLPAQQFATGGFRRRM